MEDQIDELNSLCADLTEGKINEAEFRTAAMDRFGYDSAEVAIVLKRMRQQRGPARQAASPSLL